MRVVNGGIGKNQVTVEINEKKETDSSLASTAVDKNNIDTEISFYGEPVSVMQMSTITTLILTQ